MNLEFDSQIVIGPKLKSFTTEEIKNEPMLFSCDFDFAYNNTNEPTRQFLRALPLEARNGIIDSRVHMLMEGWYPCIPGYHHDDVPRVNGGQPEYISPIYRSKHALILYNGDICPTEFAIGKSSFPVVANEQVCYRVWHPLVQEKVEKGELQSIKAPSDTVVYFDDRTWHQGSKAVKSGWRLFIRASWNTKREVKNEIRRQVQVYLESPMQGW